MKSLLALLIAFSVNSVTSMASETAEGLKKDVAAFKKEANAKLEELDKKITQLRAESKETAAKEIETTRDQIRKEVDEAKATSASKWSKIKAGIADSLSDLNAKAQKVLKE